MKILVIGGNRFFGKKLTQNLITSGHEVTLLNRGSIDDGFGDQVQRIKCNRSDSTALKKAVGNSTWDLVYDQVCFDAKEAKSAVEIFANQTSHYIFTSTQSVYGPGRDITENIFDPFTYQYTEIVERSQSYAEAKRQCEAVFFSQNNLPVTAVRFPMVVGEDDYTKRFQFHIEKIQKKEPIYFPNINVEISLISSDDAAKVLRFLAKKNIVGSINACSVEPISLRVLVSQIEEAIGEKAILSDDESKESRSPYGLKSDWFMSVKKLDSLGFRCEPLQNVIERETKKVISF